MIDHLFEKENLLLPIRWSNSADWALRRCRRKYWFKHIYASPTSKWGSPRREIYILSNVQTLEQWRGNLVHTVIQDYVVPRLQHGIIPSEADLQAFALDRARRQLNFSSSKSYRETGMTKTKGGDSYTAIWEDEFKSPASRLTKTEAVEEIKLALANLLRLPGPLEELRRSSWIVPEATIRLEENGIPVVGKIDLMAVCTNASQILKLVDWKLDRKQRHDYAPQLWLYAYLFDSADRYQNASYHYQHIPTWVKGLPKNLIEMNLLYGSIIEHDWSDRRIKEAKDRIFRGTHRIRVLLDGRNPKQIQGGELSVTENSNNCDFCPFRQPCQAL